MALIVAVTSAACGDDHPGVPPTDAAPSVAPKPVAPPAVLVRAICDRHRGIGADGVLVEDATPD